jgi:hypothetical protein
VNIRSNTGFTKPLSLKGLDARGWKYRTIRSWISIGSAALIQDLKNVKEYYYIGNDGRNTDVSQWPALVGARFILFRVRDDHRGMSDYLNYAEKVETTFRMGFKGGLHLFASRTQEPLTVMSFHFDGWEHYRRHIDVDIIGRLGRLKPGVEISHPFRVADGTGDHERSGCQSYADCQLLQLTDLLVSGFRSILTKATNELQWSVSQPLNSITDRWNGGYARMKNSRWFGGICISKCYLQNGQWNFDALRSRSLQDVLF